VKVVNSISPPAYVYRTKGSKPVRIRCDDFNFYVCKYHRSFGGEAKRLFQEYVAASFANIWKLAIPEFCIVSINPEHVQGISDLIPGYFKKPCFGTRYQKTYVDVDEFYGEISSYEKRKYERKYEFLKIALFDIWMANDDRNFNNYNLLVDVENGNRFVPIDHEAVFYGGNLDKEMVLLTEDESIITTDITKKLFTRKELLNKKYLTDIKNEYYLCIKDCEKNVDNLLNSIPKEWGINIDEYNNLLKKKLFNDQWVKNCINHFLTLLQLHLKQ
jgi:hypothetical protein